MKPFPWKCGTCRERGLVPSVIDYRTEITHDGRKYALALASLSVFRCERCGAIVLDDEADQRISEALRTAAGLLSPQEIQRGREKLGLTQKKLAHHLQVDEATLARWETGVNSNRIPSIDSYACTLKYRKHDDFSQRPPALLAISPRPPRPCDAVSPLRWEKLSATPCNSWPTLK
jgi:putative zinc finger/helix-turn-helix YgiT family protein